MEKIAQKFLENQNLNKEEFVKLIRCAHYPEVRELLAERALELRKKYYGDKVYTRGLIEFTNYCKNNCYYCGIRRGNRNAKRYRLTEEEILACCENGYELGFRTFVNWSLRKVNLNLLCIILLLVSWVGKGRDRMIIEKL